MEIQVLNCLSLPSLKYASVVAGKKGLHRVVSTISVLETTDVDDIEPAFLSGGELLISTLASIRSDIDKQCALLYMLNKADIAGLILFHVGKILPKLDERFIAIADELNFPVISILPEGPALFTDVIHDIANFIFQYSLNDEFELPQALINLNSSDEPQVSLDTLFTEISLQYHGILLFMDNKKHLLYSTDSSLYQNWGFPVSPEQVPLYIRTWYQEHHHDVLLPVPVTSARLEISDQQSFTVNICQIDVHETIYTLLFVTQSTHMPLLFMQLLSKTAQNYIDRIKLSKIIQKDDFISALITNNIEYRDYLASQLFFDLKSISSLWVLYPQIDSETANLHLFYQQELTELKHCIELLSDFNQPLYYGYYNNCWILFFQDSSPAYDVHYAAELFLKELRLLYPEVTLFIYDHLSSCEEVASAYRIIEDIRDIAGKVYPHLEYFSTSHIYFLDFCHSCLKQMADFESPSWTFVLAPLQEDTSLIAILETMILDTQLDAKKSAELLYLHRNTIYYRIKKIQTLLGYDPFSEPGITILSLSLALRRILQTQ